MSNDDRRPVFESAADDFDDYYNRVRGLIRRDGIRRRLFGLTIHAEVALDYGGGDGDDSLWLVGQHVPKIDYWDEYDEQRQKAISLFETAGVKEKARVLSKDPLDNPKPVYDLLLLHGVLQYVSVEAARKMIANIGKVMVSGGVLSLANKNFETVRQKIEAPGVKKYINNLRKVSRAYSVQYLEELLTENGFRIFNVRGIRCLYDADNRYITDVPADELARILDEEGHETTREDSIEHGRMLHVLARKV